MNAHVLLVLTACMSTVLAACSTAPKLIEIEPLRPIPELRQEALAAVPPAPRGDERVSDLVEIVALAKVGHGGISQSDRRRWLDADLTRPDDQGSLGLSNASPGQ